jgi:hypothetical protein
MANEGMICEMVTINGHNGDKISAYVARPSGSGPFPRYHLDTPQSGLGRVLPGVHA